MSEGVSDEVFARYVVQAKLATFEHVRAARHAQALSQQGGILISLADALVSDGSITPAQRDQALKAITGHASIVQIAQYRLIKELGRGGMGKVFLAEDTLAGRQVAIKILPKKLAENREFISRFRREAKATGKLNHVNIVAAYDAGEDHGRYYYVMEYCAGKPLTHYLKGQQFVPWEKAVSIVAQVAQGLKHAHDNGVLHRDIKPDNIFLASDGTAKILDLGLSKDVEDSASSFHTQSGSAVGTPHYMAPEQAKGDPLDGRADIYALGATFYHLLAGEPPYDGPTPAAVMLKHLTDEVPNPQQRQPEIPDGVVAVLRRMMARKPDERYADCDALIADLHQVMSGKAPVSAGGSNRNVKPALPNVGSVGSRVKTPALQHSIRRSMPERMRAKALSKLHVGGMVAVGALLLAGTGLVASALNERAKAEKSAAAGSSSSSSTSTAVAKETATASSTASSVATMATMATSTDRGPAPQPAVPQVFGRTPADVQDSEYLNETARFERRAQEEYDALEKKLASIAAVDQKVAALDAFEKLYGDSIAGARGRILKSKLTAPAVPDSGTVVKTPANSRELAEALNAALDRARVCSEKGDLAGAVEEMGNALKLDPTQPVIYHNRAATRFQMGDVEGALADLDHALALGFSKWQCFALRAILMYGLNREAEYRKNLEQAAAAGQFTTQDAEQRIRNDAQRARAIVVGKTFETKTPETVNDLLMRGQERTAVGRFADAAADLKEALKRDPALGGKGAYQELAELNRRMKNASETILYLKKWAEACPDSTEALNACAWELLTCTDASLRDPKLALQYAEKCAELSKNQNPAILDTLALAYFNNNKPQLALSMEEKALTLLPQNLPVFERKAYEDRVRQFRDAVPK